MVALGFNNVIKYKGSRMLSEYDSITALSAIGIGCITVGVTNDNIIIDISDDV